MANGSGLSFDPDRISNLFFHNPTVIKSLQQHNSESHHQKFKSVSEKDHHRHHHHLVAGKIRKKPLFMDMEMDDPPPTTFQFPVSLNCASSDHHHHRCRRHEDGDDDYVDEENRSDLPHNADVHHHEMDFFADKKLDSISSKEATMNNVASPPVDGIDNHKDLSGPSDELGFSINTGLHLLTRNSCSDQSTVDDGISLNSGDKRAKIELAVLQAELERMNVENQRLREVLSQVTGNYDNLQMHLMEIMQQQQQRNHYHHQEEDGKMKSENKKTLHHHPQNQLQISNSVHGRLIVPKQFMDLGLGSGAATATASVDVDEASLSSESNSGGCRREQTRSPLNNFSGGGDHGIEDSPEKGSWGPNKVARLNHTNNHNTKNVDQATEATMRKARVSVRARSEAPMITDGCQWRKYGQKIAKGNPCPRAYYRCTMAAGCPVRKQVQRCAEDRTILITTYEGNHNHPLPPPAMAMASTTSSAARMLLSGSMPSADGLMNSNFLARTLLPCSSSMATISASAPFPTVTLDLTQNPNNPLQLQRPSQFQIPFLPSNASQNFVVNPGTSLLPQIFGQAALYNQSKFSGLQMSQDVGTESAQSSHQISHQLSPLLHHGQLSHPLADTVSALTADPNFTVALAAAITSLIGNSNLNNAANNNYNNNNDNNNNSSIPNAATATASNNNGSVTSDNN